uniref:Ssu-2 homolog n=1 Tax=Paramormyrops kingsleyae TaxID=1676925 RepID=A0A3B3SBE5_9TELE
WLCSFSLSVGEFDPDMPEEGPTEPPPGWLDNVSGYEEVPSDGGGYQQQVLCTCYMVPTVSEDMAREALLQFVGKKWTYSRKPARDLIFKDLKPLTVYRYRLETFTESRSGSWEFEPYTGQSVDGPQYGSCPPPWDVMAEIPPRFTDHTQKVRVPHSSFVKTRCGFCYGSGRSRNKPCSSCHGCKRCFSSGCSICHAKGHRECPSCHGLKYLMHYILLTITWKNHVSEFIPDRIPEFPVKKFGKVSGDPFFVDESVLVYPIVGFPDQDICRESRRVTEEHLNKFTSVSRILQQVSPFVCVGSSADWCIFLCHSF